MIFQKSRLIVPILFVLASLSFESSLALDRQSVHQVRIEPTGVSSRMLSVDSKSSLFHTPLDFGDLQVSTSWSPASFEQDRATVVALADTAWLVAWQDQRMGSYKIYGQIISGSGGKIGSNFMLAGSDVGADYVEPILLGDTLDRISLFYRDRSNGLIFCRRYLGDLSVDLGTFQINDSSSASYAGPMAAAVYPSGRMAVAWENYSGVGSTIKMRVYSSDGSSVAGPVTVNSDGGGAQHWVPSVAARPSGGFLVVWEDYRNGQADVYGAQFDGNGGAIGGDFGVVAAPHDTAAQYAPRVIFSNAHEYVIGWLDRRSGQELYIQKYDHQTGLSGGNRQITGPNLSVTNWDVTLSVDSNGSVLVGWAAYSAVNQVMGIRLDGSLDPIGSPTVINESTGAQRWAPAAAFVSLSNLYFVWTDLIDGEPDLFGSRFDGSLISEGEETVLNDDAVGAISTQPVMAGSDWYHFVVWQERGNDDGDIYLRAVNPNGVLTATPTRVNQDGIGNLQGEPAVAIAGSNSLIVWVDGRSVTGLSGQRIFARRFSEWAVPQSDEFQLSDPLQIAPKSEPVVAVDADGSGLVAWVDKRTGSPQLFGQWIDTDGTLIGSDFAVSDTANDLVNGFVSLDRDDLGRYFVIWLDYGQADHTVRGEFYHADRSYGGSLVWTSDTAGVTVDELSSATRPNGEQVIVWTGTDLLDTKLWLTVLDSVGATVESSKEITDASGLSASKPSVSADENGYLVAGWLDGRSGRRAAYYQLFDSGLGMIGNNTGFSLATPEFMLSPAVLAHRGRAWYSWADPRQDGLSVYAGSYVYLPTDVDDDDDNLPTDYHLSQNYPNPFNPSTTIAFSLPRSSEVRLSVFNVLGQEVVRLAESPMPAGEHRVMWDGRDSQGERVTSGVYFYRLTTDSFTEQRKMVLVK